jgi:thiol-disulfide isomerase/thioredoxin
MILQIIPTNLLLMKRICFWPLLLLFLYTSCTQQPPLSGQLTLSSNDQWADHIYLIQPRNLDDIASSFVGAVIDSAQIQEDGHFAFESLPNTEQPMLLQLAVQQKGERFVNRLNNEDPTTDNYFPIIWKNGLHLKVTAEVDQFQSSFSITNPSSGNEALLHLRDIRQEAYQQFLQKKETEEYDEAQLLEEEAALLSFQQTIIDFAEETDQLLPALVALRWVSPDKDYERIPEFLVSQCKKWQSSYPDHSWVGQLCEKSDPQFLPVLKGARIPNAQLPMLSGDTLALYSLLGERLTILDLWASWCAPCRKENRNTLVPLWEKHHQSGFQVVGYALEAWGKGWAAAIEKDGAYRWKHASHLQGDDAPLLNLLRIQTIPANFIVDSEGKVLAKNLHGEELVAFVEGYMEE